MDGLDSALPDDVAPLNDPLPELSSSPQVAGAAAMGQRCAPSRSPAPAHPTRCAPAPTCLFNYPRAPRRLSFVSPGVSASAAATPPRSPGAPRVVSSGSSPERRSRLRQKASMIMMVGTSRLCPGSTLRLQTRRATAGGGETPWHLQKGPRTGRPALSRGWGLPGSQCNERQPHIIDELAPCTDVGFPAGMREEIGLPPAALFSLPLLGQFF